MKGFSRHNTRIGSLEQLTSSATCSVDSDCPNGQYCPGSECIDFSTIDTECDKIYYTKDGKTNAMEDKCYCWLGDVDGNKEPLPSFCNNNNPEFQPKSRNREGFLSSDGTFETWDTINWDMRTDDDYDQ